MSTSLHGTIHWLEIPVIDAARAAAFYTSIFGWECTTFNPSSASTPTNGNSSAGSIHMFRRGTNLNGAFIQVPQGCLVQAWGSEAPGGRVNMAVLTTFAVDSIEGTMRLVEDMGGRMHL
ncbi:hypothetical protein J7T55_001177 [Diaporthe amygdali]|uniref:uncharacterized protein n=1 Tax=Phomopsis amygdali TaxID=1214568 RepID=UPI0022FF36D0|nr:uncharacterized protein J7T55_001177 [Diaporthe amygdali]KAJ0120319.1 hypothetical protein J7T55_001177 [Diaporthe amygdali]